jgi:hypothetical protein
MISIRPIRGFASVSHNFRRRLCKLIAIGHRHSMVLLLRCQGGESAKHSGTKHRAVSSAWPRQMMLTIVMVKLVLISCLFVAHATMHYASRHAGTIYLGP